MKKILYFLIAVISLSSCDSDFVDILPKGKVIPENVDDLALILNYRNDIQVTIGNYVYMTDDYVIPDENINSIDVSMRNKYIWNDYIYQEGDNDDGWSEPYEAISRINYVINNINEIPDGDVYDREATRANALFKRANTYSLLISFYSKLYNESTASTDLGVPMPLKMDINNSYPRSSVKEVYDQIFSDLETAIPLLPDTNDDNFFASKLNAYALLSRIYLYQAKYKEAAEYAKKAMDINITLVDYNTLTPVYDPNGSCISLLGFESDSEFNPEVSYFNEIRTSHTAYFSDDLISKYDTINDLRFKYFCIKDTEKDKYTVKFYGNYEVSNITFGEIILNYCEAILKKDGSAQEDFNNALAYLNQLRENRYLASSYTEFDADSSEELLEEVMLERRRELRFTAHRWTDMKRLGVTYSRTVEGTTYTLKPTSDNYVLPIPLNVLSFNDIPQNPRGL